MRYFHYTHPYFFAHHHIHRQRIEAIRGLANDSSSSGDSRKPVMAMGLTAVPADVWADHRVRYQEQHISAYVHSIACQKNQNRNKVIQRYLVRQLLLDSVVVHVLRQDPRPVLRLKSIPLLGKRLRVIIEHEGDTPSEYLYVESLKDGELVQLPEQASPHIQTHVEKMIARQSKEAIQADGLVLMSREHIDLWKDRCGSDLPPALAMPPTKSTTGFCANARQQIRRRHHWQEKSVLVYTGNIVCAWQRFEETCFFISRLMKSLSNLHFLALVRLDDVEDAKRIISEHHLSEAATVTSVAHDEVAAYLSAADIGLFLRHNHLMNKVVASAKLCEYIASGLPVLSTGANSSFVNEFLDDRGGAVLLDDSLDVDDQGIKQIGELDCSAETRQRYAEMCMRQFPSFDAPPSYQKFVQSIISEPPR